LNAEGKGLARDGCDGFSDQERKRVVTGYKKKGREIERDIVRYYSSVM
jgi:hypothetical protein